MDRALDLGIGTAAAEVAGHRIADLLARRLRGPFEQRRGADDLTRGAEAALERVLGHECLLEGGARADERPSMVTIS